ncbi:hypothetical protein VNI00_007589 [Paramarasmius palmivorus]|uniref:Glutaminase A n=1 Tax=Paramarasmius palmivorus TaxID=297713 RepID=A0AAW0D382_9AGAR
MALFRLLLLLSILADTGHAQFQPAAVPLLVRSPYFSSWVGPEAPVNWPQFSDKNRILGWGGFIRVDGSVYEWMGRAFYDDDLKFTLAEGKEKAAANVRGITITPTRTIYSLSAGPVQFNITFLSPIEPQDLNHQSFPFGYVYFDATSGDGSEHNVQIYHDISGESKTDFMATEWLSEDPTDTISWNTTTSRSMVFHNAQRMPLDSLATTYMAHDGILYHATLARSDMTWQTGGHHTLRARFLTQGSLKETKDNNFRAINDDFPVFAFANDLGTIISTSQPVVWAIGYARTPVVRYSVASEELRAYWTTRYSRIDDGIHAFLEDFPDAKSRAESLDDKILSEAKEVSLEYADLVSLSARQTFGGMETAVSSSGTALMFMKDVGTSGRVNPVEIIYASFPAYLYINATWCRYLLEPLLEYQQSPNHPNNYAAPDLGANYPIAEGGPTNLLRSIEDSGSMLIMTWAHARFSGDQGLLNIYYNTLKKWADNLILKNMSAFSGYRDADGLMTPNLTNLALKGIIGVRAMAEISDTLGKVDDAKKYQKQAVTWIKDWEHAAIVNGHLASSYNSDSWGMIYNLFADKLLGMKLVSQEVYDIQDRFYINLMQSDWTMLTAAIATKARDALLRGVYRKSIDNTEPGLTPFPSEYSTQGEKAVSGYASPAQGAAFGLLSMNLPNKLTGPSGSTPSLRPHRPHSPSQKKTKLSIGPQVGIGVGVASLITIAVALLLLHRHKNFTHARDLYQQGSRITTFFRFGKSSSRNVPVNGPEDSLSIYHIEPYTIQKGQLQRQVNSHHSDRDPPRQTHQLADLDATSYLQGDIATRGARTRFGPPSSSDAGRTSDSNFTDDTQLRNMIEHLRRSILDLQLGSPPSYRTNPSFLS